MTIGASLSMVKQGKSCDLYKEAFDNKKVQQCLDGQVVGQDVVTACAFTDKDGESHADELKSYTTFDLTTIGLVTVAGGFDPEEDEEGLTTFKANVIVLVRNVMKAHSLIVLVVLALVYAMLPLSTIVVRGVPHIKTT